SALCLLLFFFQAEDGIRGFHVTGVQTCALPISSCSRRVSRKLVLVTCSSLYVVISTAAAAVPRSPIEYHISSVGTPTIIPAMRSSEERRVGKEWRERGKAERCE